MSAVFEHPMDDLHIEKKGELRTVKASTAKLILLALADHANDDGRSAYPSLTKLGQKTAIRHRQTLADALDALQEAGYISYAGRSEYNTANYTLHMGVLASAATAPSDSAVGERKIVQSVNSASAATAPKPSFKPSFKTTAAKKPSPRDEIRKFAQTKFQAITKLPVPPNEKEAGTLWWTPLREICELSQWDTSSIASLISASLAKMREGKLTVSSPKSILKVARSVYAETQGGKFDDRPESATEWDARVFGNRSQ